MVPNPAAVAALAFYIVALAVVLLYRKDGARHRRRVAWLAWLVAVVLAGSAVELMLHSKAVTVFEAARAGLMAVFIVCARGNLARLVWSEK